MPSIATFLDKKPNPQDINITSDGYAVWLVWNDELNGNVIQTLQDYGGLQISTVSNQALWFFFTLDAMLALAKLVVWGKYNSQPVSALVFPAKLQVGVGQALYIAAEGALAKQSVNPPEAGIKAWVHPKMYKSVVNFPGMTFVNEEVQPGMSKGAWTLLGADPRLPYASTQGWYSILRPLGNPIDKNFQKGWAHLFEQLEQVIQAHKFKYSLYDNFLMLPLDSLNNLRLWMREVLLTIDRIRETTPDLYWPSVSVVVDKRGLNFNNELPHKLNIKFEDLMPDYPFMNYRNAFLLGNDFVVQDRFYSTGEGSINNSCTIGLRELDSRNSSVPVLMASQLATGSKHCFYCSARNHDSNQCPSKRLPPVGRNFWYNFSELDIDSINAAFRNIEVKLSKSGLNGYLQLLEKDGPEAQVLEGVFAIERNLQLRSLERLWLLSGKDIDAEPDNNMMDDSPAWEMIERVQRAGQGDLPGLEKELKAFSERNPRDWRLQCLLGFVTMEKGEFANAVRYWQQAEGTSTFVIQQGWHIFLQGRALEMQDKYQEAIERYKAAKRLLPQWARSEYRMQICRIKLGFGESAQGGLVKMVESDPSLFNRILLDPDTDRGRKPVLIGLYPLWVSAFKQCQLEKAEVERLLGEIGEWFADDHPVAGRFKVQLTSLLEQIETKNYVSFFKAVTVRPHVEQAFEELIAKDIEILQAKFKHYLNSLEKIRDEASWFPFQKALVEFNQNFNEAASILNWAFSSDFHTPEAFRRAQDYLEPLAELLRNLTKKLRTLRFVRDATLFALIFMRTFFWVELVTLVLSIVGILALLFFGNMFGMGWLQGIIRVNFWELQKVIVSIISLAALGIAALRSTLIFDSRRDKLLEEARTQRLRMQEERLEKARVRGETLRKQHTQNKKGAGLAEEK